MRFVGSGGKAGCQRIKARLQGAKRGDESLRHNVLDREATDDIDDMVRMQEDRAIPGTIILQQLLQRIGFAEQCPVIEKARRGSGDLEAVRQGLIEPHCLALVLELGIWVQ